MRFGNYQAFMRLILFVLALFLFKISIVQAMDASISPDGGQRQQPTVDVPTVTGTPSGPIIIVYSEPEDQINVRSGPGTSYPRVGVLLNRQEVPALGRTAAGDWVQIIYPGVDEGVAWVYSPLVRVIGEELPIVEPPSTPTPRVTPTIDPTLAAQFVVQPLSTRMPTLTAPPQLVIPTFPPEVLQTGTGGVPIGFVIIGLAIFGFLGLILSFLRQR
jgi:hypothetical protein